MTDEQVPPPAEVWKIVQWIRRRQRRFGIAGLVAMVGFTLALGIYGTVQQRVDHDELRRVRNEAAQRIALEHRQGVALASQVDETRKAACDQFNVQQHQAILASDVHDQIEADAVAPPPRSPADEAAVKAALKAEHAAAVFGFPLRDCTPKGIALYLGLKYP